MAPNSPHQSAEKKSPKPHVDGTELVERVEIGLRLLIAIFVGGFVGGIGFGLGCILGYIIGVFVSIPFFMIGFLLGFFWLEIRIFLRGVLPFFWEP